MRVTPYGVKPTLKRLFTKMKPKTGYIQIYLPLTGLDMNEEEN